MIPRRSSSLAVSICITAFASRNGSLATIRALCAELNFLRWRSRATLGKSWPQGLTGLFHRQPPEQDHQGPLENLPRFVWLTWRLHQGCLSLRAAPRRSLSAAFRQWYHCLRFLFRLSQPYWNWYRERLNDANGKAQMKLESNGPGPAGACRVAA